MNRRLTLSTAKTIETIKIDHKRGPVSVVCNPAAATTYRGWLTCTPQEIVDKVWTPIADLYDKTDLQSAETGSITGLKFERTVGTGSVTIDIAQSE